MGFDIGEKICASIFAAILVGVFVLICFSINETEKWETSCHAMGGHVISAYKGPELCLRNGLIISSN